MLPRIVTELGIFILVKLVQFMNVSLPIFVTAFDRVILSSPVQPENTAYVPIKVTELGIMILFKLRQLVNE